MDIIRKRGNISGIFFRVRFVGAFEGKEMVGSLRVKQMFWRYFMSRF